MSGWLAAGTILLALLLAIELPPAARAAAPAVNVEVAKAAQQVDALLDSWRFKEAAAALDALRKQAPDAAETAYVDGYHKFLLGDYDGAVKALASAAEKLPPGAGGPQAHPAQSLMPSAQWAAQLAINTRALGDLAKEASDAIKDHKEERTPHVVIRYAPEDAVLVPYARETLEAAYKALHDDLGFEPELPIRVEFYRSPADLAAVSSLSQAEVARTGTIALCKWARLMVTTPRALAYGYPWLDSINHELVHYAVSSLTKDRAPVWLQEGLAKFLERRWREPPGRAHPAGDGAPLGQGAAVRPPHQLRGDAPVDGEAAVRRGRDAGVRGGGQRRRVPPRQGRHGRPA